jgi:capsular polysaccharide biosynthesis protein
MPANPAPARYDAPPMFLREYAGAVCLPRQVVVRGNLVLPETFTTNEPHRRRNAALDKLSPDFARPPQPTEEPVALPGRWFHLDNHLGWHFGHALTEQVSHLWGWARARAEDPSLGALVSADFGELTSWQRDLLAAGGVPPDAVHVATGPVRVERLVGCTPMFSRPAYVHPGLRETYDAISAALSERAGPGPWPRRVFLGRRSTKRACVNAAELEAEFIDAGFDVVLPEALPLADQVELVRRADVVAGYAGSAMFHVALAAAPKHVVLVVSESYPAHNEYLMSMLLGHRLDVVVCEPLVPRVDGQFTRESFHSDYTYRPEREGVFLRSVLAELPH